MLLTLGVVYAQAANYGLKIRGNDITSVGNINAGQSEGTITWDGTTLTFDNVFVNYYGTSSPFISYSGTEDLKIKFIGNNHINSRCTILRSTTNSTVGIEGELNKTGKLGMVLLDDADASYDVIKVNGNLSIKQLYLTVAGKDHAISGGGSNKISLNELVLNAEAPSGTEGAISNFASAFFNSYDAYLTTGVFNSGKKAVCDNSGKPLQKVETDASLFVENVIVGIGYPGTRQVYPKGLTAGSISYTYNNSTLTLDGISMKCSDRFIYNKKLDDLKIVVKGTNDVDGGKTWGIFSLKDLFIEGSSSSYSDNYLKIWNSFGPLCIWLNDQNSTMTLKNLTLDVKGSDVGIYCAQAKDFEGTLTIDNCKIFSEVKDSEKYSAIHGFKTCNFEGCGVNTAKSAVYYNKKSCSLKYGDGELASTVYIDVLTTTYSGITILGTPVTNLNVYRVVVEGLTYGLISYDSSTKVLQLKQVKLTAPEGNSSNGLNVSSDAVSSILVKDDVDITTEGHVIRTYGSGTITLEGRSFFNGTSTKESGLSMDGSGGFVFNVNGTVNLYGQKKGIWGYGSVYNSSIITMKGNSSFYRFKGIEDGAIINVADVKREGMDYCFDFHHGVPGCYFDSGSVYYNGGVVVKGNIVVAFDDITETYGITVADTPINNCNRYGVGSKYFTDLLSVTYNPTDKELKLTDATIDYDGDDKNFVALRNEGVDGLNILLQGDNTINTSGYIALELGNSTYDKPVTTKITGEGKLNAKSSEWYGIKIGSHNTLDIGGSVEVKAEGLTSGIANNMAGKSGEMLIIRDNAHVEAKGKISVQRLNAIQLEDGIKILKPTGAEMKKNDTYGWGIYVGDQLTSDWVVFGTAIKGDVNGDGNVDVADIGVVIDVMAAGSGADPALVHVADVNGDGNVDVADIAAIIDIMAAGARKE